MLSTLEHGLNEVVGISRGIYAKWPLNTTNTELGNHALGGINMHLSS
jgi:hypothetical protein